MVHPVKQASISSTVVNARRRLIPLAFREPGIAWLMLGLSNVRSQPAGRLIRWHLSCGGRQSWDQGLSCSRYLSCRFGSPVESPGWPRNRHGDSSAGTDLHLTEVAGGLRHRHRPANTHPRGSGKRRANELPRVTHWCNEGTCPEARASGQTCRHQGCSVGKAHERSTREPSAPVTTRTRSPRRSESPAPCTTEIVR
jgi:hypothetical protein